MQMSRHLLSALGEEVGIWAWERFNTVFNWMPLAAVIEKRVICMHGAALVSAARHGVLRAESLLRRHRQVYRERRAARGTHPPADHGDGRHGADGPTVEVRPKSSSCVHLRCVDSLAQLATLRRTTASRA